MQFDWNNPERATYPMLEAHSNGPLIFCHNVTIKNSRGKKIDIRIITKKKKSYVSVKISLSLFKT